MRSGSGAHRVFPVAVLRGHGPAALPRPDVIFTAVGVAGQSRAIGRRVVRTPDPWLSYRAAPEVGANDLFGAAGLFVRPAVEQAQLQSFLLLFVGVPVFRDVGVLPTCLSVRTLLLPATIAETVHG